jgi:hypothetical protein
MDAGEIGNALREFDAKREAIGGCYDRFCYITGKRTGQVTNGGCRCSTDRLRVQRLAFVVQEFRDKIAALVPPDAH